MHYSILWLLVGLIAFPLAAAEPASLPVAATSTASHAVEASYLGDDYYSSSISATTSLTPQPVPTTLALGSSTSTVTVGGQVTLTATVSPDSAQNYTPSGTVTFSMNGTSIGTAGVSNGVATLQSSLTAVQTDSFTASYGGDSNNNSVGSPKGSEPEVVNAASPAISTTPGGTVVIGSGAKLTDSATLSGGYNETGSITFSLYSPTNVVVEVA